MREPKTIVHAQVFLFTCEHIGYTAEMTGKNSGFRIRVERDLRDKFVEICRAQDRPAAQVIREFMRHYIADHSDSSPPSDALSTRTEAGFEKREGN